MKTKIPPADLSQRPFSLTTQREIPLSSKALYKAWTEGIEEWFAARGTSMMHPEVDRPFFFQTHHAGRYHPHYGRFIRLEKDSLVELTWLTSGTLGAETVVTVELVPHGEKTLLRLAHAGFPDEASMKAHESAWPMVLEHLEKKLSSIVPFY